MLQNSISHCLPQPKFEITDISIHWLERILITDSCQTQTPEQTQRKELISYLEERRKFYFDVSVKQNFRVF